MKKTREVLKNELTMAIFCLCDAKAIRDIALSNWLDCFMTHDENIVNLYKKEFYDCDNAYSIALKKVDELIKEL
jgi:hypothetical protein